MKETTIGDLRVTAGTEIVIPVYSIHHDPDVWPEPEEFKPERFYKNKDWNQMGWLPFGNGPRNCIGLRFAEMEYKKTLVRLLKHFSLVFGPDSDVRFLHFHCHCSTQSLSQKEMKAESRGALIVPPHGVIVNLQKR